MSPTVSIIVPIYKVEPYLARCVDSILAQTYKAIEIILVNDGSPDNCPAIADSYAEQYPQIQVIHKQNGGLSDARKAGWKQAKGEYVLFIDSDDYILPEMVQKLVQAMEHQQADLAMCAYYTEDNAGRTAHKLAYQEEYISKPEVPRKYLYPLMGKGAGINIPGFMCIRLMKRSLIEGSFFVSENQYFMEDHVFDLEYADKVNSIAVANEPLYVYCINRASLSNRYRPGKWQMYVNLYHYFRNYISTRGLKEPADRLAAFLKGGVFACIDNAVLSGSFSNFKKELRFISCFPQLKWLLNIQNTEVDSLSQKISFTLLRFRLAFILYIFRRFVLALHA